MSRFRNVCFTAFATALVFAAPALAKKNVNNGGPVIKSATIISSKRNQTITIKGTGFGTQDPYSGTSPYISIGDKTRSWEAGYSGGGGNVVGLTVSAWTDTEIDIDGFNGQWGGGGGQYVLVNGDVIEISVGNPTKGIDALVSTYPNLAAGPCLAVVGSKKGCVGPK
jgi:hypothetical protein